jgi:hypothetical protein
VALAAALVAWSAPGRACAQPTSLPLFVRDGAAPAAEQAPPAPAAPQASPGPAAPQASPVADPFFPGRGHVTASLASGIPFAAIGEVTVGTSDAFSLSAIAGVTDTNRQTAFGGSLHAGVFRSGGFAVVLSLPVLYYPPNPIHDDEPWLLTNPSLVLSYRWDRASVYGGAGGLFTTCIDGLAETFGGAPERETTKPTHPMVNGAWNTFNAGGSFALTRHVGFFVQATVMMSGIEIGQTYAERVGPPVLALGGVRVGL